jgi:NAD(P)H-dependent FMN reductase
MTFVAIKMAGSSREASLRNKRLQTGVFGDAFQVLQCTIELSMPGRVLILFAHPAPHKSRINRRLIASVQGVNDVTINDLYEEYPTFDINVQREQELLLAHDIIVFQHPFYWYSSPAILKEWEDLVLEYGFAYGAGGTKLHGKLVLTAITIIAHAQAYRHVIEGLRDGNFNLDEIEKFERMNEVLSASIT